MKRFLNQIKSIFLAKEVSSDMQTLRLFAILAVLTVALVFIVRAVQFTPNQTIPIEVKRASEATILVK